jgi:O-antigen/teichoic acid export membrane protein
MSLKKNILANYASQIYVTLVGIVMVPVYFKYMGVEVYGLIGFFAMIQTWFQLLDIGLTPTISREAARYKAKEINQLTFYELLRALSYIFWTVGLLAACFLFFFSGYISVSWLNLEHISNVDAKYYMELTSITVGARWLSSFYKGAISGYENFVWLGYFNSSIASLRFIGVIPILLLFDGTPQNFFLYQLVVSVMELGLLYIKTRQTFPFLHIIKNSSFNLRQIFSPVKRTLKFSLSVAFTSSIWIFVTQSDKLVLSRILSLSNYGEYSLAVMAAGSILIITAPITAVFMPSMVLSASKGDDSNLLKKYKIATQLVVSLASAATAMFIFFSQSLLWVWTGDKELAERVTPVLILYAVGNYFLIISGLVYLLQYAKGMLRMHVIGSVIYLMLLIPSTIYFAIHKGVIGSGVVWVVINLLYLIFWVPVIYTKLKIKNYNSWLIHDVLKFLLASLTVGGGMKLIPIIALSRVSTFIYLFIFGLITLIVSLSMSNEIIYKAKEWFGYD